jgi:hypothetical protein
MDKNNTLLFFFTALYTYLEEKGVLNNKAFAEKALNMLEDERFNFSEQDKEELKQSIELLLPLRIVK